MKVTDEQIQLLINQLRNRGGWWEGDQNARKVLRQFLDNLTNGQQPNSTAASTTVEGKDARPDADRS